MAGAPPLCIIRKREIPWLQITNYMAGALPLCIILFIHVRDYISENYSKKWNENTAHLYNYSA
jgi:hypothetical protein